MIDEIVHNYNNLKWLWSHDVYWLFYEWDAQIRTPERILMKSRKQMGKFSHEKSMKYPSYKDLLVQSVGDSAWKLNAEASFTLSEKSQHPFCCPLKMKVIDNRLRAQEILHCIEQTTIKCQ